MVPTDISTLKFVGTGVAVIASVVEPLIDPTLAAMMVCPAASLVAKPLELIVATDGEDELQFELSVTSLVSPLA